MLWVLSSLSVLYGLWTWHLWDSGSPNEPPYYSGALPIIVFFLTCGVYTFRLMARQRKRMKVLDPPELPGRLPLVGHSYILYGGSKHIWNFFKWVSQESLIKGGVITMNIGPNVVYGKELFSIPIIFSERTITDPDDLYTVANSCLLKDYFYDFAKPWLGSGLLVGSGPIWKRHRRLLNPTFNQQVLDGFMDVFNNQSRRLVLQLSAEVGKAPFVHLNYLSINSLETIFQTIFGVHDKYSEMVGEYLKSTEHVMKIFSERLQKFWLHSDLLYNMTKMKATQDKHIKLLHKFSNMIIKNRKTQFHKIDFNEADHENTNKDKFKPLLNLLLELSNDEKGITDQEIREEVDNFMVAGHETSAYALMYTLMTIGSHPNVQEKIIRELQDVIGCSDRDVTKLDLCRLQYLEAVIKETLRLYPIAPIVSRYTDCEVKLNNYTIPPGCSVLLLLWGVHHHSVWGPDASQFKPERWLSPSTLPANSNMFTSFSIGKRNCIGKAYAMMSMKTTLTHLLRQYQVSADVSKMTLKIDVLLRADTGNLITLDLRKPKNISI